MKKWKMLLPAVLSVLGMAAAPLYAHAEVPYKTYTIDGYGYVTETQTAYTPKGSFNKVGSHSFVKPTDIKITGDGYIYIADPGAKVVWVSTLTGGYVGTIGEGELAEPYGIFVTEDKHLYVADRSGKVLVFDPAGGLIATYTKPSHPLYGKGDFKPVKIVVNSGGDMYIVCEGNSNGLVQLTPEGFFLGYFGTNNANVTLLRMIQEAVFTEEQLARMVSNLPSTPVNVAIDRQGLIYTVTPGLGNLSLKKLNIAGTSLIEPDACDGREAAVAAGNHDNIYVASSDGYIYEYNSEGDMLFVFGGRDDGRFRIGLSSRVEAIAVDANDNIYTVDSDSRQVQYFEATEFTSLLHSALNLYENGRYIESMAPLLQVLETNSLFDYANEAISRSYLQVEDYPNALKYARVSKAFEVYSDAFWEVRNMWLRENLIPAAGVILAVCVIVWMLKRLQRKKGIFNPLLKATERFRKGEFWKRQKYMVYYMKHPIDGAYGLRYENKSSYLTAGILIALTALVFVINKYYCGFLLRTIREARYTIPNDVLTIVGVFVALTACCYLMCTINDGEGSFKRLFCGFAFALTPYILFEPICTLLSNVITYNEVFLIGFGQIFIYSWCVVLLFLTIKEVNNYTVAETIKIIFLTAFTVLILALLVFIIYVLFKQIIDFVSAVAGEVAYRYGK